MKKNIKIYQNKILAERFRSLMAKHQITLKDIAKHTDSAVSTVSTWRRGRLPRNQNTLKKISKLFGVSPKYLLGESQTIFSNEKQSEEIKSVEKEFSKLLEVAKSQKDGLVQLHSALVKISKNFLK